MVGYGVGMMVSDWPQTEFANSWTDVQDAKGEKDCIQKLQRRGQRVSIYFAPVMSQMLRLVIDFSPRCECRLSGGAVCRAPYARQLIGQRAAVTE